jgi:hypothetical protein
MVLKHPGGAAVLYRVLAELVLAIHLAFLAFLTVGALLAWRWPWLVRVHVPVVAWAVAIVAIGFTCPLTPLEKLLRRRAGDEAYEGGFIDHYLEDVVYPREHLAFARAAVATLIFAGYAGLLVRRHRPRRSDHSVGREIEAGHDRRLERPVPSLVAERVSDSGEAEADHVERDAVDSPWCTL